MGGGSVAPSVTFLLCARECGSTASCGSPFAVCRSLCAIIIPHRLPIVCASEHTHCITHINDRTSCELKRVFDEYNFPAQPILFPTDKFATRVLTKRDNISILHAVTSLHAATIPVRDWCWFGRDASRYERSPTRAINCAPTSSLCCQCFAQGLRW